VFLTAAINAYTRRIEYSTSKEFSTKRLIYRFALLPLVTLLCVSCTSTDFQSWEGRNSVVEGRGGTRKVVDGMDVWTHGDPPRRFQVLGIIEDERPGGVILMAQLKHDIVDKARQSGGDAVIFVSSASQLAGYYTSEQCERIRLRKFRDGFRFLYDRAAHQT
jgi:hypothetical protein